MNKGLQMTTLVKSDPLTSYFSHYCCKTYFTCLSEWFGEPDLQEKCIASL